MNESIVKFMMSRKWVEFRMQAKLAIGNDSNIGCRDIESLGLMFCCQKPSFYMGKDCRSNWKSLYSRLGVHRAEQRMLVGPFVPVEKNSVDVVQQTKTVVHMPYLFMMTMKIVPTCKIPSLIQHNSRSWCFVVSSINQSPEPTADT